MAEDEKKKLGLHKKISSIFEGVPLPQPDGLQQQPPQVPPTGEASGTPQKPLPPPFQTLRAAQAPRPFESGQTLPQAAPAGLPKAAGSGLWQQIKNRLFAPKPGVSTTRQKVMVILVPVLFIVLILVATTVLAPSRKVTRPPQAKPPTIVAATDTKIDWEVPPPYPETFRDPMQPVPAAIIPGKTEPKTEVVEPVKPEKLVVKGILYSDDNPSAIIGTQIVHQGDKVSGATVIKINKDGVEFEREGEKWKQGVEP